MVRTAQPPEQTAASRELAPLLRGVAGGDHAALAELYQRTSAKLYGICIRLLPAEIDAQDVLQDVYLTVWRKAGLYDQAKASPITWLAVMARNKAIDRLRGRQLDTDPIEAANDVADDDPSAFDIVERGQERERLANCLGELEPQHAAIIRAAFVDGLTYAELAARDAVPLGTMKSWIRRGLLRLRGCLER
ncbi:sigma-70 family RNA polymerase sigma factor [Sphingomonas sp.]|uniref:sigma-70 family RNA polymerase sigma factor n=1 Tax=Sphingomonas sp. TaxID=28214 RepID=UPI00286BD025|nr:sigma-70 family RNA polymerase sigma factor [Sphingomonas sp.]